MSKATDQIQMDVMREFEQRIGALSAQDYKDLVENLAAAFESRLEVAKEELEGESE